MHKYFLHYWISVHPDELFHDERAEHIEAESPEEALEKLVAKCEEESLPLFGANVYYSDEDYNKPNPEGLPIKRWMSIRAMQNEGLRVPRQLGTHEYAGMILEV